MGKHALDRIEVPPAALTDQRTRRGQQAMRGHPASITAPLQRAFEGVLSKRLFGVRAFSGRA
jgi:hypothetical protein